MCAIWFLFNIHVVRFVPTHDTIWLWLWTSVYVWVKRMTARHLVYGCLPLLGSLSVRFMWMCVRNKNSHSFEQQTPISKAFHARVVLWRSILLYNDEVAWMDELSAKRVWWTDVCWISLLSNVVTQVNVWRSWLTRSCSFQSLTISKLESIVSACERACSVCRPLRRYNIEFISFDSPNWTIHRMEFPPRPNNKLIISEIYWNFYWRNFSKMDRRNQMDRSKCCVKYNGRHKNSVRIINVYRTTWHFMHT